MRRNTFYALACAAVTVLILTAGPAEAGTCYSNCEIAYFDRLFCDSLDLTLGR
ncbi:MAG: hypothetical protein AAF481_10225 [Acidobacteriota bacterium]